MIGAPQSYIRWHIVYSFDHGRTGRRVFSSMRTNVAPPAPWPLSEPALDAMTAATRAEAERLYGSGVEDLVVLSIMPLRQRLDA